MSRSLLFEAEIDEAHVAETLRAAFDAPFFRVAGLGATGVRAGVLHWWIGGPVLEPMLDASIGGRRRSSAVYKGTTHDPKVKSYLDGVERSILRWKHDPSSVSPFERAIPEVGATFLVGPVLESAALDELLEWRTTHERVLVIVAGAVEIATVDGDRAPWASALRTWTAEAGPGDLFVELQLSSSTTPRRTLRLRASSGVWLAAVHEYGPSVLPNHADTNLLRLVEFWARLTSAAAASSTIVHCSGQAFAAEESRIRMALNAAGRTVEP